MNYIYKLYKQKDHGQRYRDTGWKNISDIWNLFRNHGLVFDMTDAKYNPGGIHSDEPKWKRYNVEFKFKSKNGIPVKLPWVLTAHAAGTMEDNWESYDLSFYPTGNVGKDEEAIELASQKIVPQDYINEEILKFHKITLLESRRKEIKNELNFLNESFEEKIFNNGETSQIGAMEYFREILGDIVPVYGVHSGAFGSGTVMFTICFQPREEWAHGIMENSNYFRMSLEENGEMEVFAASLYKKGERPNYENRLGVKFRKAHAKSLEDAANKLIKFINTIKEYYQ